MREPTVETVFGPRGRKVPVERKSGSSGSKPGDRIRQGRVDTSRGAGVIRVTFEDRSDGCCYAMLARAEVGVICVQPQGGRPGFNWLCFLPEQRTAPRFAETKDKACDALRIAIERWCEAAGLIAQARRHPHAFAGHAVGWRADE